MKNMKPNQVWVVVEVVSGVPSLAEVYQDKHAAEKRELNLRKRMRLDYDEVGIFETVVKVQPR